jgi:hypothetical protein
MKEVHHSSHVLFQVVACFSAARRAKSLIRLLADHSEMKWINQEFPTS